MRLTPEQRVHLVREFAALTPKARRILAALAASWSGAMTRDEIAAALGQPRLYAHDLKMLDKLTMTPFIGYEKRRRWQIERESNPEFDYIITNAAAMGVSLYRLTWGKSDYIYQYWINESLRSIIKRMIKSD